MILLLFVQEKFVIVKRIDTGKNTGEENKLSISCKLRLDCANISEQKRRRAKENGGKLHSLHAGGS